MSLDVGFDLNFNEVQELTSMYDIIARHRIQIDMLNNGLKLYIGNLVQKHGLDTNKKYVIRDNKLIEVKDA